MVRPSFFYFFVLSIFFATRWSENEIKIKIKFIRTIFELNYLVFSLILIQFKNGPNEFYFYFTNKNGNISSGAVTGGNLINLAAVEKTK